MAVSIATRLAPYALRGAMVVSGVGIAALTGHEGLRTTGYLDSVGIPTVCYGHTRTAVVGKQFSMEQCEALLNDDLAEFSATVNKYVEVPLSQPQFDSLVSFCYNVGSYACRTSTLFRTLNSGDYYGAANQFDRWKFAQGRDCTVRANNCYGVWNRRMAEKELFLAGTAGDNSPAWPVVAAGSVDPENHEEAVAKKVANPPTLTEERPHDKNLASDSRPPARPSWFSRLAFWRTG